MKLSPRRLKFTCALLGLLEVCSSTAHAGKFNKKLSVGDRAPVWTDLNGVDGKLHSFKDYESPWLVVIFTCNQCPVATAYQTRFNTLAADYQERGVTVVAINVNRGKAETLEKMAARAKKASFAFDYLRDESQTTALAYGARTTPTVFLLNAERKLVYQGAFDDNGQAAAAVEHHYLLDALNRSLAGKTPEIAETRSTGCLVSFLAEEE